MDYNVNTKSDLFNEVQIGKIEQHYNAKYVCETCLKNRLGGWANFPVAIFYTEVAHPEGSNYFGLFFNEDGNLVICNGISATEGWINGIVAKNGEVIYSKYRHDFRTSTDGSVTIDGGRDYLRLVGDNSVNALIVELKIVKDKLVVDELEKVTVDDRPA